MGATNESDAKTSMANKEYFIYEKESDYHRSSYHLHLVGGCSSLICKSCGRGATINSVENGVAYATINKQDAGFLAPKLPGNIEFNTSDLDVKLQAGDEISGCYLSGTINGSSVRVVDVTIKGNASQGINDLISLNEVSDYITEKGYTSKDFEESLMGRFREDIIRSWGASDLLFSGINADGWYLDDDKNRGISLTYDGDGYVCEVVIWSGEKETGVDR